MWTYNQSNGFLSHNGELAGTGYSGFGYAKNDPACEQMMDLGPIPRGKYTIDLPSFDSELHGPVCLRLTPQDSTNTFGRAGFLIHGDSIAHPGSASHGCIILPRPVRLEISESSDDELEVV